MKVSVITSKSANRYNDWSSYQKFGPRVGSISWKALLRPLSEVTPLFVSPEPVSSASHISLWKRIVLWFKSLFKSLLIKKNLNNSSFS